MNQPTIPEPQRRRLQAHFAFTKIPFRKNMWATEMFDSRAQRELYQGLGLWTEIAGLALVTGPSGVGKSITLRRFLNDLDEARFNVIRFSYLPTTVTGFLHSLARALGLRLRCHTADLFDDAQRHLATFAAEHGPHPVLVIDDAEGLTLPIFDLIRRLTAYDLDAEDRFSVLLAGTDEVSTTLRHPGLDSLRSRIGYAQTLRPFSLDDTRNYVRFHLKRVGANEGLFSDDAVRRVFQASAGKPRHINQLALQALVDAAVEGVDTVSGDFVRNLLAAHPLYQASTTDAP
jgi:type II secretory pathway predicted ATPase ExeA